MLNVSNLRFLACFFMVLDHIGILLEIPFLRILGRISYPLFAYLIVNGFYHTRNIRKYLFRLLLLALVSELFFDLYIFDTINFARQNVLFTFFFSLLAIYSLHNLKSTKRVILFIFSALMVFIFACDYGLKGFVMVLCFYYFEKYPFICFLGLGYMLYLCAGFVGLCGLLSIFFIHLYSPKKKFSRKHKMLFYSFYPLQYMVLYFVEKLL